VVMEDILKDLVINWDQTSMKIVPSLSWTMEKRGTKRVEIAAADDKMANYCFVYMYSHWSISTHSIDI